MNTLLQISTTVDQGFALIVMVFFGGLMAVSAKQMPSPTTGVMIFASCTVLGLWVLGIATPEIMFVVFIVHGFSVAASAMVPWRI